MRFRSHPLLLSKLILAGIVCLFAACSDHPDQDEVEETIAGTYCAAGSSLVIGQGHYHAEKKNALIPPEVCEGRYELRFAEDRWEIHYLPDTLADYTVAIQCEKIFTLWTRKEGFLTQYGKRHMRDLFTNAPLPACGAHP